jgi:hypothetical protein
LPEALTVKPPIFHRGVGEVNIDKKILKAALEML